MFFSKSESKKNPVIIFDIGSASIGATIALISETNDLPEIIYDTRIPISFKDSKDYNRFMSATISAFKNVVSDIEYDGVKKLNTTEFSIKDLKGIYCIFSSLWHISSIETFKFKKDKVFNISADFISDTLKEANNRFLESSTKQLEEKHISNPKLIEKNIIQALLNGYNTDNIYDKEVKNIDITLFMSALSKDMINKVTNILDNSFNTRDISFNTFTLSSFLVVRDIFKAEKDFLLIDISGEVTDITLSRNETMLKNKSFLLGKNFLIRGVADLLGTMYEEAHSLIRLYLDKNYTDKESAQIEKALNNVRKEWLNHFRKILSNFSDGLSLPKTIFLGVDKDIGRWFADTIKSDEFSMHTLAQEPFTIVELSGRILGEHCVISQKDTYGCDQFLAIGAIFASKIVNK